MNAYRPQAAVLLSIGILTTALPACVSKEEPISIKEFERSVDVFLRGKSTRKECTVNKGSYIARKPPGPNDIVDCQIRMARATSRMILANVYEYLYSPGSEHYLYEPDSEKPLYGLYSYVLFPAHSSRAELFLKDLFRSTPHIIHDLIDFRNLNVMYLPTRTDKNASLMSMTSNGTIPHVGPFATQFYNYALARKILAQICAAPRGETRRVCATDLSRGPYVFTHARPASSVSPVPLPFLFLDMSHVNVRAFGEFIASYKAQVKRSDYTDRVRVDTLHLRLLNIVLTAADWIDLVRGEVSDVVYLAKSDGTPNQLSPSSGWRDRVIHSDTGDRSPDRFSPCRDGRIVISSQRLRCDKRGENRALQINPQK